jgi:hypothetical protein
MRKEFTQVRIFGRISKDTILKFQILIDGQDSGAGIITVDNDDIATGTYGLIGSPPVLGAKSIGGGSGVLPSATLKKFRKIIDFRARSYDIQLVAKNDQTAALLELKRLEIQYLPLTIHGSTPPTLKL